MRRPPRTLTVLAALGLALAGVVTGSPGAAQAAAACSQAYLPLPDPLCQPGVTYSAVTQSTIDKTICVSGWTATVRPPTSYTNALKKTQIAQYDYDDSSLSD